MRRERAAVAGELFARRRQEDMTAVLHGWAGASAEARRLRALLTKALHREVERRCSSSLQRWQDVALQSRRRRWALRKSLDRYELIILVFVAEYFSIGPSLMYAAPVRYSF